MQVIYLQESFKAFRISFWYDFTPRCIPILSVALFSPPKSAKNAPFQQKRHSHINLVNECCNTLTSWARLLWAQSTSILPNGDVLGFHLNQGHYIQDLVVGYQINELMKIKKIRWYQLHIGPQLTPSWAVPLTKGGPDWYLVQCHGRDHPSGLGHLRVIRDKIVLGKGYTQTHLM